MKISYLFLILCGNCLWANMMFSQEAKVTIHATNIQLEKLLSEIENQTDYLFIYSKGNVAVDKYKVSINATNQPVKDVLDRALDGSPIRYVMEGTHIVLSHASPRVEGGASNRGQGDIKVSGVIIDQNGEPLIGANVQEKGTTNGTITDLDGRFSLLVPSGTTLEISYIGYLSQEVKISEKITDLRIVMREDSQSLDEVVVVGYGVQKKKLVTGATVQVKGDDIQKLSTNSALGALQSQTPGVQIRQSSGLPGEGFKVNVRGIGTIGDSAPLYVIDGIAGGDINALNPSDIESIDVLKDAASAAIYGARAANGVILVTTKQGRAGKVQISYDGYVGWQKVSKYPDLLNARQYMEIEDMMQVGDGNEPYDWKRLLPGYIYDSVMSGAWNGTDWMREMSNEGAMTQNHSVNLTGGSESSKFAMGLSYTHQEGIFGNPVDPTYERYTARMNSEHVLLRIKDFEAIKIGENLTYSFSNRKNMTSIGDIYGNDIHNALVANPLMPMYSQDGELYDQPAKNAEGWTFDGTAFNPIALMTASSSGNNQAKRYNLQGNLFLEIQPIKNLKWRSVFGYKMTSNSRRSYNNIYYVGSQNQRTTDQVSQSMSSFHSFTWENTISYSWKINEDHVFDAVLGQSIEKWGLGENLSGSSENTLFPGRFDYAWIDNANPTALNNISLSGYPSSRGGLASFFGRINYNYKEKYMASVVMRSDGSSNFARGHRWGYFPSVSAGWVITNEDFMESLRENGLDFLKIRGSWGGNGNSSIDNFQYLATIASDSENQYYFGTDKLTPSTGSYADILPNEEVTWETSEQLDFGFDARVLDSRLGIAFDWYKKTTKDWLVAAPIPALYGTGAPYINGGDVQNKGVEIALNWNDQIGDFSYGVAFNIGTNKNEVTRIANTEGIIHGPANVLSQATDEMFRAQVGFPIGYFWGFQTEGVFQNQAQIDDYRSAGKGILQENVQPGDLIFSDTNHDGAITDDDKVMMGDPNPNVTSGLTLTLGYKGFDFAVTAYGAFGHQIAKSYRSYADSPQENFTTDIYGVWTGEGTSNKLPRLTNGSNPNWQEVSDIVIENADYVKISNITFGYDFQKLFPAMPFSQARLYVTAQNLFTVTGYSGLDPEVGYSGNDSFEWGSGVDLGFYPSPKTFLIGVNLKF